ncbi:hypothetical protein NXV86_15225 [Bacteroides sp. BFG-257]|uniref:hypothetical protein n=1 Tax=unclassified Bacteroides TaxID=2646097 RepID=UPI0021618B1B|nr:MULTISPECIES: hypothetical protein [unclassified Bacteroides]UVO96378.1 hypothetical protein NXV86_15225 [Bacteroides sp. BFG-257]
MYLYLWHLHGVISVLSPYHLHAIFVSPPYLLRTISIVIGIGLVRRWYGADTEQIWR